MKLTFKCIKIISGFVLCGSIVAQANSQFGGCIYKGDVEFIKSNTRGLEENSLLMQKAQLGSLLPLANMLLSIDDPNCLEERLWLSEFVARGNLLKQSAELQWEMSTKLFEEGLDLVRKSDRALFSFDQ